MPQHPDQQQPINSYDALDNSSSNNKLNRKYNNDKDKSNDRNREASRDSSLLPASVVIIDESCPVKSQKSPTAIEPSSSIIPRGGTSSSQRRRQLQFQRQKEATLYDRGDEATASASSPATGSSSSQSVKGGGELVNCIAYDDNTLVIERKPSPTSPATSRRYLKADTPTRGSRKYNRKSSAAKSDLEVVMVKPDHQHRSPTITLPVPSTPLTTSASAGTSPTGAALGSGLGSVSGSGPGTGTGTGTVLQQRYLQLQLEHEKKYIFQAMQEFDYMEQTRSSRA